MRAIHNHSGESTSDRPADAPDDLGALIEELVALRDDILGFEAQFRPMVSRVSEAFEAGAKNLLHYIALRRHDIRALQRRLAALGLSSLGRSESHVFSNLTAVLRLLHQAAGREWKQPEPFLPPITLEDGARMIADHADALLGPAREDRAARIMVTLPTEAAEDPALVRALIESGMDCARINCAHDNADVWARMAANVREAASALGRPCKVLMDLAGPKLRTGAIEPGPAVLKWQPRRNERGIVIESALLRLTPAENPEDVPGVVVPVSGAWLATLAVGDDLVLSDLRRRKRTLRVVAAEGRGFVLESKRTGYMAPGLVLKKVGAEDDPGGVIGPLPSLEQAVILGEGDTLVVTGPDRIGRPARFSLDRGREISPAQIPCTLPEVFADVKIGERVLLDDGKIAATIEHIEAGELRLRVTRAAPGGVKLRADKGINFPDSMLHVKGLTARDTEDLSTVVALADIVALSFVSGPGDVADLQRELSRLGGAHLGVVAKIETRQALERLTAILLQAMSSPSVGVMIARGDLAVECGFEFLAEAQEEILWISEAAHVPVIWATQVLENLAKSGLPSRAEITDTAMSGRAECVLLGKGPHILETIRMAGEILHRMEGHQHKKSPLLGPLDVSDFSAA
ncbi:MAG: pyruvate kinase [Deltaproteobacteria bacterium]|nr:pyruvate kinase [Deltaproteobacteria bacterium]